MKTLIIGANGIIGNALFNSFCTVFPGCIGLTSKINPQLKTVSYDFQSLRDHLSAPDIIVYCVGVTKFADCERDPAKSLYLNAQLPQEVLKHLSPSQKFVYFSSPVAIYNFRAASINKYMLHKRKAEEWLQEKNVIIIRPSKVIESAGILKNWKTALEKNLKITAFADQSIAPIDTSIIAEQLLKLLHGNHFGVYNFSARDRVSYLDLAKMLCANFGLDVGLIEEKSARTDNPFYLDQDVLDCSAAEKAVGYVPPFSSDIVETYFRTLA